MRKRRPDGKYLTITEGTLRPTFEPEKPLRVMPPRNGIRRRHNNKTASLNEARPGWSEHMRRKRQHELRYLPRDKFGRPKGLPDGETKETMAEKQKNIRAFLGEPNLEAIKARLDMEEDPIVQMIMTDHVATILENHGERDTLYAKKELMVYLKAKPVTRIEQKVSEADEAWAEEIDVEALNSGKDAWKPN